MNYYEHFLGDYNKKTTKLRLVHHGAYRVLLDTYYAEEKPLPGPYAELYTICRAIDKDEQQAVRKVADLFFPLEADGLRHNERADAEIARAQKRIQASRDNGKTGGRKPKTNPTGNPSGIPEETQQDTYRGTQQHTQGTPQQGTRLGEALPHTPSPIHLDGGLREPPTPEAPSLPGNLSPSTWRDWRAHLANRGKSMTPQQERLNLVRLAEHKDPENVVLNAINSGHVRLEPIGGWEAPKQATATATRNAIGGEIFGDENDERNQEPRDITGEAKRIA